MFWNQFFIAALRDSEGTVINYVGVQCKVDEDFVRAVQRSERVFSARLHVYRKRPRSPDRHVAWLLVHQGDR